LHNPFLRWGWFGVLLYFSYLFMSIDFIQRKLVPLVGSPIRSYVFAGLIGLLVGLVYWASINRLHDKFLQADQSVAQSGHIADVSEKSTPIITDLTDPKPSTPSLTPKENDQSRPIASSTSSATIPPIKEVAPLTNQVETIKSIAIEGRLTCTLKDKADLPPGEVPFLPVGDANAYLEGPQGKVALNFSSPVRFKMLEGDRMVVINRFYLPNGSDLQGRPLESLANYNLIIVPVVTIVWGRSLHTMALFEVSMSLNGNDIWYYPYHLNAAFQEGPVFRIPLDSLKIKLAH
jgi:hypothetical protein